MPLPISYLSKKLEIIITSITKNDKGFYVCNVTSEEGNNFSAIGSSEKQAIFFAFRKASLGCPHKYLYPRYINRISEKSDMIVTIIEESDLSCGVKCDNCNIHLIEKYRIIKEHRNNKGELQYTDAECINCGAPIKIFND
jgi:hypothetical protein